MAFQHGNDVMRFKNTYILIYNVDIGERLNSGLWNCTSLGTVLVIEFVVILIELRDWHVIFQEENSFVKYLGGRINIMG